MPASQTPARIVIRAHEHWHNDYLDIVKEWLRPYDVDIESWPEKHYVHLLGIINRRFHIIIDMHKSALEEGTSVDEVPYDIYRLHRTDTSSS